LKAEKDASGVFMQKKIFFGTVGSVLLITLAFVAALGLGSCNVMATDEGQYAQATTWISLEASVPSKSGGTRTATLSLDFSKPIDALEGNPSEEELTSIFSFGYSQYPEETLPTDELKATGVINSSFYGGGGGGGGGLKPNP
jgi:hypothetical protein